MTKDQKADAGGDPWESRRPLIHHWAPGQGHSTCEALWKTVPPWQGSHAVSERGPSSSWHLSVGVQSVACSPKAQHVCSAREAVSTAGDPSVAGMCRQEICADVLGLVCSDRELLILLPAPSLHPWDNAALVPTHPAGWSRSPCLVPPQHCAIPQPMPSAAVPPGKLGFRGWS